MMTIIRPILCALAAIVVVFASGFPIPYMTRTNLGMSIGINQLIVFADIVIMMIVFLLAWEAVRRRKQNIAQPAAGALRHRNGEAALMLGLKLNIVSRRLIASVYWAIYAVPIVIYSLIAIIPYIFSPSIVSARIPWMIMIIVLFPTGLAALIPGIRHPSIMSAVACSFVYIMLFLVPIIWPRRIVFRATILTLIALLALNIGGCCRMNAQAHFHGTLP